MNKQISFDYEGKTYTLEYTRNSVRQMERRGFVPEDSIYKTGGLIVEKR